MRTALECIPCFVRQALDSARRAGLDKDTQRRVMDEVSDALPGFSVEMTPPEIARIVYDIVDKYTSGLDVYKHIKEQSNRKCLDLYLRMKEDVSRAEDSILAAIRLAAAGNVIDYGLPHAFDIEREIKECSSKKMAIFDYDEFRSELSSARDILLVLDNAGEIVFDRILVETLGKNTVCAVRGKHIINDVTIADAKQVGLDKTSRVISSGSRIPGTVVRDSTPEFKKYWEDADIVISKGQGNFETLGEEKRDVYFIFKAKCPVVARCLGCQQGDIVLKKQKA
ncbi:MAG TPA: ARMT1-like domain-containing protein [Candidatus Omnitrophota bacterium]|nr:ARMT1-like domain-containing protein [Candidatus Omnitrophota bacterium]HPS20460.1 ARMT1-like domain-containing protein [Candidatus Omnitrophota bacterium]